MATNINQFIFSRTQPQKKLEIIKSLSEAELLAITPATIMRMVKEAGNKRPKSRNKELYIDSDRQTGNNWNSTVESVELFKGKLYLTFYVQYENTDTSTSDLLDKFLCNGRYRGTLNRDDRYGNPRSYYFCYDADDKARVIKTIADEYIYTKYHDKLK